MNVVNDLSFLSLITGATIPVQLVMIILLAASGFSWWYIFIKISVLKNAELAVDEFENTFWTSGDLNKLHDSIHSGRIKNQGLATIFEAGYKEFNRHKTSRADMSDVIEGVRRAMRATYNRELDFLDAHLPFLASVGSVSPYIGLFGTVWGIMNAFRGLANVAQATLTQVAPGIAEALIATAIGLFAAIPAVLAFNHYTAKGEAVYSDRALFAEEMVALLQRQSLGQPQDND